MHWRAPHSSSLGEMQTRGSRGSLAGQPILTGEKTCLTTQGGWVLRISTWGSLSPAPFDAQATWTRGPMNSTPTQTHLMNRCALFRWDY